jgi:hypothetical protein
MVDAITDSYDALRTILRSNVADPWGSSRTKQWIYPGHPRVSTIYPRMSIVDVGAGMDYKGIGENNNRYTVTYEIIVWVHKTNKFTINSSPHGGAKLCAYLGDQVIGAIQNASNRNWAFKNYGVVEWQVGGTAYGDYDDDTRRFTRQLTVRVEIET